MDKNLTNWIKTNKVSLPFWFFASYGEAALTQKKLQDYSEKYNKSSTTIDLFNTIYDDEYLNVWLNQVTDHFKTSPAVEAKKFLKIENEKIDRELKNTVVDNNKAIAVQNTKEKKEVEEKIKNIDKGFIANQQKMQENSARAYSEKYASLEQKKK